MSSTENERDSGQESDHEENSGNPVPGTSAPNERKRQAVAVKMDEQTGKRKKRIGMEEKLVRTGDALTRLEEVASQFGRIQDLSQLSLSHYSIVSANSNNETTLMETSSDDTQPMQEPGASGELEGATRSPIGHVLTQELHHGFQPVPNVTSLSSSGARANNPPLLRDSSLLTPRAGIQNVESNGGIPRFVVDIRHPPGNGHGNVQYHFHF